jgi:phosphoribosylglycinamide formyltransferase 1
MAALLAAGADPATPVEIRLVLSNVPAAPGLVTASNAGAIVATVDHKAFAGDRERFERAVDAVLRAYGIELVALAGFMRVLTPWFVERWSGRLINIHPSLLPAFPGLDTHARALAAGVSEHGCTVHHVVAAVDAGAIIAQARVPVLPGDTVETLAARVLLAEHQLYPQALARVANDLIEMRSAP